MRTHKSEAGSPKSELQSQKSEDFSKSLLGHGRIWSLLDNLSFLMDSSHPSLYLVRKLASVFCKIISLGGCIGNVARFTNSKIFAVINSAINWNSMISLMPGCVDGLNFWKVNLLHICLLYTSPSPRDA